MRRDHVLYTALHKHEANGELERQRLKHRSAQLLKE
jgi:hypothetical protein